MVGVTFCKNSPKIHVLNLLSSVKIFTENTGSLFDLKISHKP